MSAARCVSVWNLASGTPNCLRVFRYLRSQPQRLLHRTDGLGAQRRLRRGLCRRDRVRTRRRRRLAARPATSVELDLRAAQSVVRGVRPSRRPHRVAASTRNSPTRRRRASRALTTRSICAVAVRHRILDAGNHPRIALPLRHCRYLMDGQRIPGSACANASRIAPSATAGRIRDRCCADPTSAISASGRDDRVEHRFRREPPADLGHHSHHLDRSGTHAAVLLGKRQARAARVSANCFHTCGLQPRSVSMIAVRFSAS